MRSLRALVGSTHHLRPLRPTGLTISFVILLLVHLPREAHSNSGWSFLPNQQHCRLTCLNGGVCAYEVREPSNHKCICFIGMWAGEQCEVAVGSEEDGAVASTAGSDSAPTDSVEVAEGSSTEEGPLYQLPEVVNSGSVGHQQPASNSGGERESEIRQHPVHHVHEEPMAEGRHQSPVEEGGGDTAVEISTTDEPATASASDEPATTLTADEETTTVAEDVDADGTERDAEDPEGPSTSTTPLVVSGEENDDEEEKEELNDVEEAAPRQSATNDGVVLLGGSGEPADGRVNSAEFIGAGGAPYTSTIVQYANKRTSTTQRMGEMEEVTTSSVSWRGQDPPSSSSSGVGGDLYHEPPPRPKKKKKGGKSKSKAAVHYDGEDSPLPSRSPPRYDTGHNWMSAKSPRGAGSHAASGTDTARLFGASGVLAFAATTLLSILTRH